MKYHPQPVRNISPLEDNVSMELLCKVSKLPGPAEVHPLLGCDYVGVSLCFSQLYVLYCAQEKKTPGSYQLHYSLISK